MKTRCIHDEFSAPLLNWFDQNGRKNLPWKDPATAYTVWISEIMLQQTQVQTVIPYFLKFIKKFPELNLLAEAYEDEVLALWAGLGYYSRARNLHKTAQIIAKDYQGNFPADPSVLKTFPGIGESTAAAIASQAFDIAVPILDANVKRVLARYFQVKGQTEQSKVKMRLWELAAHCMPDNRAADYTQAIMDLGALICKPAHALCLECPLKHCLSRQDNTAHLYPEKKQKKEIPLKHMQFLLLHDEHNNIYLEKRPPTGIWGGLWSLPGIDMDISPSSYLNNKYSMRSEQINPFMHFKHSFTHFQLILHVITISVSPATTSLTIHEPEGIWFSASDIQSVGLPKPVQKIVSTWFNSLNNQDSIRLPGL